MKRELNARVLIENSLNDSLNFVSNKNKRLIGQIKKIRNKYYPITASEWLWVKEERERNNNDLNNIIQTESIEIAQGKYSIAGQPLPEDISLEVDDLLKLKSDSK